MNKVGLIAGLCILILLSACCDKNICADKNTGFQNTLYFSFNTDIQNGNGFMAHEIDTIYLRKYDKGQAANGPVLEELTVTQSVAIGDDNTPFDGFDFVIASPRNEFLYKITDIVIEDMIYEDKCNKCLKNKVKTFKVNGVIYDMSGSNEYVVLFK